MIPELKTKLRHSFEGPHGWTTLIFRVPDWMQCAAELGEVSYCEDVYQATEMAKRVTDLKAIRDKARAAAEEAGEEYTPDPAEVKREDAEAMATSPEEYRAFYEVLFCKQRQAVKFLEGMEIDGEPVPDGRERVAKDARYRKELAAMADVLLNGRSQTFEEAERPVDVNSG